MHILPKDEIIFIKYLQHFSPLLCEVPWKPGHWSCHLFLEGRVDITVSMSIKSQTFCIPFYSTFENSALLNITVSVCM